MVLQNGCYQGQLMIEHFADLPQLSWACLRHWLLMQVASDSAQSALQAQAAASDSAQCLLILIDIQPMAACFHHHSLKEVPFDMKN